MDIKIPASLIGPKRVRDDKLYRDFAILYHDIKDTGLLPLKIAAQIQALLDIKPTTYYDYLRIARKKGFILDSFEETREAQLDRQREKVVPVLTGPTIEFDESEFSQDESMAVINGVVVEEMEELTPEPKDLPCVECRVNEREEEERKSNTFIVAGDGRPFKKFFTKLFGG